MDELLDEVNFDAIVLGTGLTESILSAALARAGKKVLHLDQREYYGGNWSTMSFGTLHGVVESEKAAPSTISKVRVHQENEHTISIFPSIQGPPSILKPSHYFCDEDLPEEGELPASLSHALRSLLNDRRNDRFNIDLMPSVLWSSGQAVELLVQAGVYRYVEFRCPNGTFLLTDKDGIQHVACSKSDVFKSKYISMIEKRKLMLFVNQSLEPESEADKQKIQELAERPFSEWMEHRKLSAKLQDIILYGVLFIRDPNDPRFTTSAAISLLRRYVRSIGRYGESPFIYPIYGCSELPQAYSRLSAIHGGMFVLRRGIGTIEIDKETKKVVAVETDEPKQKLKTTKLVLSSNYLLGTHIPWHLLGDTAASPPSSSSAPKKVEGDGEETEQMATETLRCVCITDKTLMADQKGTLFQLVIPPGPHNHNSTSVLVQQMDDTLMVCPKGSFLVFFSVAAENPDADPEAHLRPIVESLLRLQVPPRSSNPSPSSSEESAEVPAPVSKEGQEKPTAVWACFYADGRLREQNTVIDNFARLDTDIFVCRAISASTMDHDESVVEAKALFERLYPGTPFLPQMEENRYNYEKSWEDDTSSLDSATLLKDASVDTSSAPDADAPPADSTPAPANADTDVDVQEPLAPAPSSSDTNPQSE